MQDVSTEFKNELNKTIRNRTFVEVKFQMVDNKLTSECTTTDNGHAYYSGNKYLEQSPTTVEYATLEEDYWLLDGSKTNLPSSNYAQQPIILSPLSDENGNFVGTKPTITITATDLSQLYSLIGITIEFDKKQNDYATNFTIERYNNGTRVGITTCTNDSSSFVNQVVDLEDFTQLKIIFNSINKPYRRVRISNIVLGTEVKFTENDIISITHKKETDVLSREIMQNSFEVTIDNYNGQYNADNPTTLNKYLQDYQKISVDYFQEMDDGTLENVNGGRYYLSGTPKIDKNQATFYATGLVEKMTDVYYRPYENDGASYKAILTDIFSKKLMPDNLGTPSYEIDDSLDDMICTVPIPPYAGNEVAQLICNATNMVCLEDVDSKIHITPCNVDTVDYKFGLNEQFELPTVSTLAKLKNINVKFYSKVVANSTSEVFSNTYDDLTVGTAIDIDISYSDPCKDGVATVTNGTLNSATYYAYGCKLNITPTKTSVTVKVNGYDVTLKSSVVTLKVNETGEDCDIDNPLICTREQALAVAENFKTYLLYRNTYSLNTRGNIALDINDVVGLETQFSGAQEPLKGIITSSNLKYDGAIKSELEVKGTGLYYNYLESTNTQYIDTGIPTKNEIRIIMSVQLMRNGVGHVILGNHYSPLPCSILVTSGGYWQAVIAGTVYTTTVPVRLNKIYQLEFYIGSNSQYLMIDGEKIVVANKTISSTASNIFLFKRNSSSSNGSYIRAYLCQIYSSSNLVRNYIAVKDGNNVACMYDKVSNQHFYNQGTGEFLFG